MAEMKNENTLDRYASISGHPGGGGGGTPGHPGTFAKTALQMLVEAPGLGLKSCNKYSQPWG